MKNSTKEVKVLAKIGFILICAVAVIDALSLVGLLDLIGVSLFGQANPVKAQENWNSLTGITSIGFAIWYGWYTSSKTLPRMNKDHQDTLLRMQESHRLHESQNREAFQSTLHQILEHCHHEFKTIHEYKAIKDDSLMREEEREEKRERRD